MSSKKVGLGVRKVSLVFPDGRVHLQEQDPQTWSYAWDLDREAHSTQEQRRRYYTRVLALQAHEVGKYEQLGC